MKTIHTRVIAGFLTAVFLMLTLVGCKTESENMKIYEPSDGPGLSDLVETDKLVLYSSSYNVEMDRRRVDMFKALYDVEVEIVVVPAEEYEERVINDLMAGNGPDIVSLYNMYQSMDINKAALNNNFLDLTNVLAEDPEFHRDDYLDGVFEACQYYGCQYVIPFSCMPPLAVSTKNSLDELGFSWDNIHTVSDYLEELAYRTPNARKNTNFEQMFYSKNSFRELLLFSGIPIVDYETGEVLPDEKGFREFLEAYKLYFPYDYDPGNKVMNRSRIGFDVLTLGRCAFWFPLDMTGLSATLAVLNDENHEYVIHAMPGQTEEAVGYACSTIAISANAKNSLNAYRYIKFLLSETAQKDEYVLPGGLPILKEAIRDRLNDAPASSRFVGGGALPNYEERAFTEEEAAQILETLNETTRFIQYTSEDFIDMVYDSMLPFFKAEDSYKNCLAELRSKLTFYLSE